MINVNEYFGGNVKSLGYVTPTGKSTIGIMEEGEYEFGTSTHETMTVIEGTLEVMMPNETEYKSYGKGEVFEVDANSSFKVKSIGQTSYLCQYQ